MKLVSLEFCFLSIFSAVQCRSGISTELSLTQIGILLESQMETEGADGDY